MPKVITIGKGDRVKGEIKVKAEDFEAAQKRPLPDRVSDITLEDIFELMKNGYSLEEFFKVFKITCRKCKSDKIEFGGATQLDEFGCYYSGDTPDSVGMIICKCHSCGNGIKIDLSRKF